MNPQLSQEIVQQLEQHQLAARTLRSLSPLKKNRVLLNLAKLLKEFEDPILKANQADLAALDSSATPAFRDRLELNRARLEGMALSLKQVAKLNDPVGEIVERKTLKNALKVKRLRAPLGVILMIFESRPNVAIEAFSLAFKAGNVILLRGGKESTRTTSALYSLIEKALKSEDLASLSFWGIANPDRGLLLSLLQERHFIDIVVPRGGDALIDFVVQNSKIPIIKNDRGLCHVYVHEDADLKMAEKIVVNAKTQRPGVCNAMESLLVHEKIAPKILPRLYSAMTKNNLEWFACAKTREILKGKANIQAASPDSWKTEYLDFKMNSKVVASLEEALQHIEKYGSRHSEAIVTKSKKIAKVFLSEVDAAATYWNASTRFTDGFELGLGGELGVSTQKLHVRGPVGLNELTSLRWQIEGRGQIRS